MVLDVFFFFKIFNVIFEFFLLFDSRKENEVNTLLLEILRPDFALIFRNKIGFIDQEKSLFLRILTFADLQIVKCYHNFCLSMYLPRQHKCPRQRSNREEVALRQLIVPQHLKHNFYCWKSYKGQ
jgi:hypothetical protein